MSPSRVFRSDAEPLPAPWSVRVGAFLLVAFGVFGAAWWQSGDLKLAAFFVGGLAAVAGILALAARGLAWAAYKFPRRGLSPYLVHGLAALGRPGASSTGALVSLGLGVLVVVAMALIESRLDDRLTNALPEDAPSAFLVDVQPEQWEGVRALMEEMGARGIESQPVITARLAAINGRGVREIAEGRSEKARGGPGGRNRWSLTREQRLTWAADLPASNRLVKGELWSDPDRAEMSLEEGFAKSLDVDLGSTITFDVQGIPIDFVVTSLREVEWESFAINFFLMAEPGTLEKAPGYRLAVGRFPPEREGEFQNRLAAAYPNVTMLRVREIIEKVVGLLRRLAFGVRALGAFTVLAGLAILAGSIASTTLERGRETALLKTLGVTRAGVLGLMATEYGMVGAAAGFIGGLSAYVLAWVFLDQVLNLEAALPWWQLPLVVLGAAAITVVAGLLASARALTVRPIVLLRG